MFNFELFTWFVVVIDFSLPNSFDSEVFPVFLDGGRRVELILGSAWLLNEDVLLETHSQSIDVHQKKDNDTVWSLWMPL